MSHFTYSAFSQRGEVIYGAIEAASQVEALALIHEKGLRPFQISEGSGRAGANRSGFSLIRTTELNLTLRAGLARSLATLLHAQVGIDQALKIARASCAPKLTEFLSRASEAIAGGKTLSAAFADYPGGYKSDEIAMIKAGEESGSLATVLEQMANLLERRLEIRQKVTSALVYPILLVFMSVAAVLFILAVLIPNIQPLFEGSGAKLPLAMSTLLKLADIVKLGWPAIVLSLAVGVLLLRWLYNNPGSRQAIDRLLLRSPVFGPLVRRASLASFARTIATLLQSGVHLQQALNAAAAVLRNHSARREIERAREDVIHGKSLSYALRDSLLLDPATRGIITLGEETNRLSEMLFHVARDTENGLARTVERSMALLTPLLTLLLGLGIGGLIMSVMQAILSVNEIAVQ